MKEDLMYEISVLRKELKELETKVHRLEHIKCGLCNYEVMGGKKRTEEGEDISISPVCWHCSTYFEPKKEETP